MNNVIRVTTPQILTYTQFFFLLIKKDPSISSVKATLPSVHFLWFGQVSLQKAMLKT